MPSTESCSDWSQPTRPCISSYNPKARRLPRCDTVRTDPRRVHRARGLGGKRDETNAYLGRPWAAPGSFEQLGWLCTCEQQSCPPWHSLLRFALFCQTKGEATRGKMQKRDTSFAPTNCGALCAICLSRSQRAQKRWTQLSCCCSTPRAAP